MVKKSAVGESFIGHVVECMGAFGPVDARRMFGGWGLYREGVFFALIIGDTLYLKAGEANRAEFDARGLEPFTFVRKGETIVTSYRAAPEEVFEDPLTMARWAKAAYAAALHKPERPRKKARAAQ